MNNSDHAKTVNIPWCKSAILKFAHLSNEPTALRGLSVWKKFAVNAEPKWNRDNILRAWEYTVEPFQRNLPVFSKVSQDYFKNYSTTVILLSLPVFGDLSGSYNMFQFSSVQWSFLLTEPQLTKGIAHFLKESPSACWCLVVALFEDNATRLKSLSRNKQCFLATVKVEAEAYAENNKRIDLVISWCSVSGQKNCVVLECKLAHHISHGQLGSYARFARKHSDNDNYELFVVAQNRDNKSNKKLKNWRNKEWHYLEWKEVLRRWELHLSHESLFEINNDFPRFRRTLWERTVE